MTFHQEGLTSSHFGLRTKGTKFKTSSAEMQFLFKNICSLKNLHLFIYLVKDGWS